MINVLIGIFYVAFIALISYLLYYIIKNAIKDAYSEMDLISNSRSVYENTDFDNKIDNEED